jgi:hypothetical protein
MSNSSTARLVAIQDNRNKQTKNNAGIHAFFKRFELAVPVFEQYDTIHVLDYVARVSGCDTINILCTSKPSTS